MLVIASEKSVVPLSCQSTLRKPLAPPPCVITETVLEIYRLFRVPRQPWALAGAAEHDTYCPHDCILPAAGRNFATTATSGSQQPRMHLSRP